ncbi:unnamed protein product [Musa acuminata subsp. malaccensis]|uniref:RING-type E3 ubiquitin transferase n=1 Tax=Musa acuminata subsp. malaccensis TaxID=214687 RepID=A0A804KLR4_MUSAM|nr:PREDICTED: RING-H2 finger protein ATL16-like [Musa acuminata subsp. malaccensis]CAG1835959.1 unnamed protein product [Musa acuminata subsp. malaccensis]
MEDNFLPSSMDNTKSFHPPLKPQPPPPSPYIITSFPILALSIIGILTTSIVLLSYYVFVTKCCLNWHRSGFLGRRPAPSTAFSTSADNLGLDESTIQAIPTFRYRKRAESARRTSSFRECAVCLSEFQEEERVRLLPSCFHVFHIDCVDTWLQTSANCPLCRSSITAPIPPDHYDPYHSNDEAIEEEEVGSDDTHTVTEQRLGDKTSRRLQHRSSMGDECIDVRERDEQFRVQPMRRSFSMDSWDDRQLCTALQRMLQQNSQLQDVIGESSSTSRLRRSFFSFGRASRSAVLPVKVEL